MKVKASLETAGLDTFGKLADHSVFHEAMKPGITHVVRALSTSNSDVHESAAGAFKNCLAIVSSAESSSPRFLVKMLKKEPYTIQTFIQLAQHTRFHHAMKPRIPYIVDLLKHGDDMDQISAIGAFADLADYPVFHEAMKPGITHVVKLSASNGDVHESAADVFKKLLGHRVFRRIIESEVPCIVKMLKKKEPYAIQTFIQLAQHTFFHRAMKPGIPYIVDLLKYGNDVDQISAIPAFADMADYPIFHEGLNPGIPHLQQMFNKKNWYQHHDEAAGALGKLTGNRKAFSANIS
ncbi:hypothetical protein B0H13DRAFT_2667130 [Mycena leptocephala]|nr:hypothetical protein B0H13DRAFT_2667130 [Mycena leptocephala]